MDRRKFIAGGVGLMTGAAVLGGICVSAHAQEIASAGTASIERIHPDGLFKYDGMAQVVAVTGGTTLHISGQTAMDKHMNLVGGNDYYAQASAAFANLKIALAAGGASYQNLVSTTIHIKDIGPVAFEGIQKAMHEAFDGKPIPEHAMTMIGTTLSAPEILLEVSAVAVI